MKPWTSVSLMGGLLAVVIILTTGGEEPRGYWAPQGYVDQADSLIRAGAITLACANLDPVARDTILTKLVPGSEEETFFASSYLRADVRSFNRDPRASVSPFRIDGCQLLGVNPFYHRIDLPNSPQILWRGDVRYSTQGRVTSLHGPRGQTYEVHHPASPFERQRDPSVSPSFPGDTVAHVLMLKNDLGGGYLADVTYIGSEPVITDRRRSEAEPAIRINGFQTFQGRPVRLEEGDWLRFEVPGGPQTFLVDRETRRGTSSLVRLQGGSAERLFLVDRDRPFVEPLSNAMNEAVRSAWDQGKSSQAIANMDVRLSLDLSLTEDLNSRLQSACGAQTDQVPDRPRSVSLIVMDAFTGEVRAMPSCPSEEYLDQVYPSLSDRVRQRFLRNQNLVPHPIGSAGKPFWAAAVATKFPNFLDFRIGPQANSEIDMVLGCDLVPFENSFPTTGWVGLETYLQRSCNRYQVMMATTALMIDGDADTRGACSEPHANSREMARCLPQAAGGEPSTSIRFCDFPMQVVLSDDVRGVGSTCDQLQLLERNFLPLRAFEAVTNARTEKEPRLPKEVYSEDPLVEQYRTARYRVDSWRDVLDSFTDMGMDTERFRVQFPFASASPQTTNLQINTVSDLRSHWVNLLLGGENSQWSNFQLAEALARLMTGRRVTGRFVSETLYRDRRMSDVAPADLLDNGSLRRGVRRRVLHAMELVVQGGTAGRLQPQASRLQRTLRDRFPDDPYDVYVFAKTGTPYVEKMSTRRSVRVLERLVREGEIRWNQSRQAFDLAAPNPETYYGSISPSYRSFIRDDVLGLIEQAPEAFTRRPGERPPEHPVYLEPSGRVRVNALTQPIVRRGAVLVLGVLAVPSGQGRVVSQRVGDWVSACALQSGLERAILSVPPGDLIDSSRSVALSSVLFIDDLPNVQGITSGRAVNLMQDLLPAIETYLVREVAVRVRGG